MDNKCLLIPVASRYSTSFKLPAILCILYKQFSHKILGTDMHFVKLPIANTNILADMQ